MKIDDLPFEIWHNIIRFGIEDLEILNLSDLLNLSAVNKLIYNAIHQNVIWYRIFRWYYFDLITQYNIVDGSKLKVLEKTITYSSEIPYFEKTMRSYRKEVIFRNYIKKYRPRDEVYNVAFFLDNFTNDFDYIPIIKNYEKIERRCYVKEDGCSIFNITRRSLACNLLNAYNFKLGVKYFIEFINRKHTTSSPRSFEWFWYNMNYFDKAFPGMVVFRQTKLTEIYALLHKEICLEILHHRSWGNKVQLIQNDETSKRTIVLRDDITFGKLLWYMLKLILSRLGQRCTFHTSQEYFEYMESYYLEDFSVLRIYSENVKGHPILIYSILMKILDEFLFSKYKFSIGFLTPEETITIKLSNTFLIIRNHYFLIPKNANKSYTVDHYTSEQVIQYLRNEFNLSTLAQISSYLKPLELNDMLTYFLNLDTRYAIKSFHSINDRELYLIIDRQETIESLDMFPAKYRYEEYQFAKFVCNFLQLEYRESGFSKFMHCSEFEKYFNQSNNFIHFNCIIEAVDLQLSKKKMLTEYFKLNLDDKCRIFQNNFNLMDAAHSRIAFGRICPKFDLINSIRIQEETYKNGQLVIHTKFNSLGIILGIIESANVNSRVSYCKVYTSQGNIETYSTSSLRKISCNAAYNTGVVANLFLSVCGIDSLGLLYFSAFKNDSRLEFIQID